MITIGIILVVALAAFNGYLYGLRKGRSEGLRVSNESWKETLNRIKEDDLS